jgi:hypothetical protein
MPPVSRERIRDIDAFWRLKSHSLVGLNSFQAMRTVAFCAVWQREGGSVDGVVASGYCARRSAYYRLEECHAGAFEPGCVDFALDDGERWEELEREGVRGMEEDYRREVERAARRPFPIRALMRRPRPPDDLLEALDP